MSKNQLKRTLNGFHHWQLVFNMTISAFLLITYAVQFCTGCGDGGSFLPQLPCVRCDHCQNIYCVSEHNGRPANKGCIDVPSYARDWICPPCQKACASNKITDFEVVKKCESKMNVSIPAILSYFVLLCPIAWIHCSAPRALQYC